MTVLIYLLLFGIGFLLAFGFGYLLAFDSGSLCLLSNYSIGSTTNQIIWLALKKTFKKIYLFYYFPSFNDKK